MLTESLKVVVRSAYSKLEAATPGFRRRRGQMEMIGHVSQTLGSAIDKDAAHPGKHICVIEGKTGTGKTAGYLIPAIPIAKAHEKCLIISSATVALQEQLFYRDIPHILESCGYEATVALAKGRSRYVCPERLQRIVDGSQTNFLDDGGAPSPNSDDVDKAIELSQDLIGGHWDGDRDSLPIKVSPVFWAKISTDANGCAGKECSFIAECPYYAARARISTADIVVANHDLVLASLTRNSVTLPSPDDAYYIFDEAHHLPDHARAHFSASHSLGGLARSLSKYPALASRLSQVLGHEHLRYGIDLVKELSDKLTMLQSSFMQAGVFAKGKVWRFPNGELSADLQATAQDLKRLCTCLADSFAKLVESLKSANADGACSSYVRGHLINECGDFLGRIESARNVWGYMSRDDDPPAAKWVELGQNGDITVSAGLIAIGSELRRLVWNRVAGAVLTSATLTSLNSFSFFRRRVGLGRMEGVTELAVTPSFDYARQGMLCLPKLKAAPSQPEAFIPEITELLPRIVRRDNSGTLVLFQSKRQMEEVAAGIGSLRSAILVQGTMPMNELLDRHREILECGGYSIIFGLSSLGEGVDLPGKLCEHVIVTQIPFQPPDSPLDAAIAEWIERCGGNPFTELSLPKASLVLNQRVGRLLRREDDIGHVTILDSRILTKQYGETLISGLPPLTCLKRQLPNFELPVVVE